MRDKIDGVHYLVILEKKNLFQSANELRLMHMFTFQKTDFNQIAKDSIECLNQRS